MSTPSTTSASRALVVDLHRGQDARAPLAQHARVDPQRADVLELDGARREIRRDDPTVGERGEPTAQTADIVEHREQRAAHAAVRAAQVCGGGRPALNHDLAGAFDLPEVDADETSDPTSGRLADVVHGADRSDLVATTRATLVTRDSAPASTSSTRACE